MAELARDRRRWSWKGSETAELARGSGMAELARAPGPARRRLISSGVRRRRISSAARRRRSWPELGDGEAGRGSGRRNWPGLGDGGVGKGSETVELARGSETVSRPELRDGETGQTPCFCLFIGVFGRVNCSWIGNSGAGKGSETAGWPGARRRRSSSETRRQRSWPELGLRRRLSSSGARSHGEAGWGSEMEELASLASGDGKGLETAMLVRARRPQSWSGLGDGGAAPGLGDGGAGL